jgi:hypothetical protein
MARMGVYFVNNHCAFTMAYLKLTYMRMLRANVAPGQESSVRNMIPESVGGIPLDSRWLRDNILHALEAYALAGRSSNFVYKFDLDHPAKMVASTRANLLFSCPTKVKELCFDGHFGVHRQLETNVDPPRSVALRGRPRLMKYKEHERSCSCANKEKTHVALPNRTAGWQFVVDPESRRVLGAKEHLQNECVADKMSIVGDILQMENVEECDGLVHDDNCTFEKAVAKSADPPVKDVFKRIKYYVVDLLHIRNHKCSKRQWTKREKKRFRKVRTAICESFNSWVRRKNFILNSMRPASHRFWVEESIRFYNKNLKYIPFTYR